METENGKNGLIKYLELGNQSEEVQLTTYNEYVVATNSNNKKYDLKRIIDELDTKAFYEREELLMRGFNHCENCRTILKNEDKLFFWCYMRIFLSCKKCFSSLRKSFPKPRISEEDLKIELDSMKNRRNNLKGHKYGRLRNKN